MSRTEDVAAAARLLRIRGDGTRERSVGAPRATFRRRAARGGGLGPALAVGSSEPFLGALRQRAGGRGCAARFTAVEVKGVAARMAADDVFGLLSVDGCRLVRGWEGRRAASGLFHRDPSG